MELAARYGGGGRTGSGMMLCARQHGRHFLSFAGISMDPIANHSRGDTLQVLGERPVEVDKLGPEYRIAPSLWHPQHHGGSLLPLVA